MRARNATLGAGALLLGLGCREDPPYTPFGVASSAPAISAASAVVAQPSARPPAFSPRPSVVAPPSATRWSLEGVELTAPAGHVLARGVAADLDGDGARDGVTWSVPAAGDASPLPRGELRFHSRGGEGRQVLRIPGFIPTGPDCAHHVELTLTGPRTVTLDVGAACTSKFGARVPRRAVVVLAPARDRPLVVGLRVADDPVEGPISVTAVTTDRDGDGTDDVALTLSQRSASAESTPTTLVWLDRAAGASRDPLEPTRALGAEAKRLEARAQSKGDAEVSRGIDRLRRGATLVCSEGGVPRVLDIEGSALDCSGVGAPLRAASRAEVHAAVTRGDLLEAIAALGRDGFFVATLEAEERADLVALVERNARVRTVTVDTPTVTVAPWRGPRFGPLAFDATGALLATTTDGVVRVLHDGRVEPLAPDAGVAPFGGPVTTRDGRVWKGVTLPCDSSRIALDFEPPAPAVHLEVLAPRPGVCAGGKPARLPKPSPLTITAAGIEALVAGSLAGSSTAARAARSMLPGPRGTAASPDGRRLVTPSALGLVVVGGPKTEIWRSPDLRDPLDLSDCTVANEAKAVACVLGSRVLLATPRS